MAQLSTSLDKIVTTRTGNLSDAAPVDARVLLSRLFGDQKYLKIVSGNTTPSTSNRDALWWHTDIKTMKRYDAIVANWVALTPEQWALHVIRRAILGAVTEINLETGDLFMFWDVSAKELKIITRENMMSALGALRTITTNDGIKGGGTLAANRTFTLDFLGLTAKPVPSQADLLAIFSVANNAHRKVTVAQMAESILAADAGFGLNWFYGMM